MQRLRKRLARKLTRRRYVRYGMLAGNLVILVLVLTFVLHGPQGSSIAATSAFSTANASQAQPLDQLSSADIAVTLASMTDLPESSAVVNQAQSVSADLAVSTPNNVVVSKPQEVATALKSRRDITAYVVQPGDTVASIAAKFNITSDSVMWSNGLKAASVNPGTQLVIPPVNGIVYTVQAGDTPDTLAQKYGANKDEIIAYNDAEISGLSAGERIIIPNGQAPAVKTSYTAFLGAASATYGGFGRCVYKGVSYSNYGYDCGFCTWWVAFQRAQNGEPVPSNLGDARTWKTLAARYGLSEGNQPHAGAVMWFTDDHVAYVSDVAADGTVTITEMNHVGWGIENSRTFPAADAGNYTYIY